MAAAESTKGNHMELDAIVTTSLRPMSRNLASDIEKKNMPILCQEYRHNITDYLLGPTGTLATKFSEICPYWTLVTELSGFGSTATLLQQSFQAFGPHQKV